VKFYVAHKKSVASFPVTATASVAGPCKRIYIRFHGVQLISNGYGAIPVTNKPTYFEPSLEHSRVGPMDIAHGSNARDALSYYSISRCKTVMK